MSTQEIINNNVLLAEFMGILYGLRTEHNEEEKFKVRIHQYQGIAETEGLHINHSKFHSSWDWLMPVAIKLKKNLYLY